MCNVRTYLILLLLVLFVPISNAQAEEEVNCDKLALVEWNEARTQAFAIIFSTEEEELAQTLLSLYSNMLDIQYQRFKTFFETSLSLPISIRIYPTESYYKCLNALAPEIPPGSTHSHIGSREIALIGENISANFTAQRQEALKAFRYELAILFVEQIADKKAPPGLLAGVGVYIQEPSQIMRTHQLAESEVLEPPQTWRYFWEDENTLIDADLALQAATTVAYLADVYGWPTFLTFLEDLRTSEGYRPSLADTYKVELSDLQKQWQLYYPLFFQGRWRAHVLYSFDLSVFEELLAAGAYTDADQGLREAITFLEKIEKTEKLEQAQAMLEQAKIGQEASALVSQSRQALQNKEYVRCIELADQAQNMYEQIGDHRRLGELDIYRGLAREVLDLRAEVDRLRNQVSLQGVPAGVAEQLVTAGLRLGELGDTQGQTLVREVLQEAEERQRSQQLTMSAAGGLAALVLLGIRIWLSRRAPSPEAQL